MQILIFHGINDDEYVKFIPTMLNGHQWLWEMPVSVRLLKALVHNSGGTVHYHPESSRRYQGSRTALFCGLDPQQCLDQQPRWPYRVIKRPRI